jgi:hypothetical protein
MSGRILYLSHETDLSFGDGLEIAFDDVVKDAGDLVGGFGDG